MSGFILRSDFSIPQDTRLVSNSKNRQLFFIFDTEIYDFLLSNRVSSFFKKVRSSRNI